MLKIKTLLILFLFVGVITSCKKDKVFDPAEQARIDEGLITAFITKNNIPAIKHTSGLYYQIIAPGTGSTTFTGTSKVTVNYEGKLLNGNVFDKSSSAVTFDLGRLITGWQIGIPLIQKGGKIRLIIPSALAYGTQSPGSAIPANAVLDFNIELTNVQ